MATRCVVCLQNRAVQQVYFSMIFDVFPLIVFLVPVVITQQDGAASLLFCFVLIFKSPIVVQLNNTLIPFFKCLLHLAQQIQQASSLCFSLVYLVWIVSIYYVDKFKEINTKKLLILCISHCFSGVNHKLRAKAGLCLNKSLNGALFKPPSALLWTTVVYAALPRTRKKRWLLKTHHELDNLVIRRPEITDTVIE